jgi:hypothetical protein
MICAAEPCYTAAAALEHQRVLDPLFLTPSTRPASLLILQGLTTKKVAHPFELDRNAQWIHLVTKLTPCDHDGQSWNLCVGVQNPGETELQQQTAATATRSRD